MAMAMAVARRGLVLVVSLWVALCCLGCGAAFVLREGDFKPYAWGTQLEDDDDSVFCSQPAEALDILFMTSAPRENLQDWQIRSVATRCLRAAPVRLLAADNSTVKSFSTTFTFALAPAGNASAGEGVDGLAFVLVPALAAPPAGSEAGYLGVVNRTMDGAESSRTFAVEFDAVRNRELGDPPGDHVGIDVNGVTSVAAAAAGSNYSDCDGREVFHPVNLDGGSVLQAWITYNATTKRLAVTLSAVPGFRPRAPVLEARVELAGVVQAEMWAGFSSSTGRGGGFGYVFAWSFDTGGAMAPSVVSETLVPENECSISRDVTRFPNLRLVFGITIPMTIFAVFAIAGLGVCYLRRVRRRLERQFRDLIELENLDYRPRKFSYKELAAATEGFSAGRVLGSGGFGTVYRGVLPGGGGGGGGPSVVAVKRIAPDANGVRESMAEAEIIGRCHHRNLVQLLGWCCERNELLLVSEYMPNGSLDQWLFKERSGGGGCEAGGMLLPWTRRLPILCGVAAALAYLHEEWKQVVVHRDVKASNVLLDSDYNGKLGDFGLARLHEHKQVEYQSNVVAGTLGYVAPEARTRGRFTDKSDVYSFGALALEVTSGRRPVEVKRPSEEILLVLWVWDLYEQGRILEAVDASLVAGDVASVDEKARAEMAMVLQIGLLCSHPDPDARPSMTQVVLMLKGEAPLPPVASVPPRSKSRPPSFSFSLADKYIWADHSVELGMIENSEEINLIPQQHDHSTSFSKERSFSFVL